MPQSYGYGYRTESYTLLDKVYRKYDSVVMRKNKISNAIDYYTMYTAALVVTIWLFLGVTVWFNDKKLEGFSSFFMLTLFVLSLIFALSVAVVGLSSSMEPSLKKIARKNLVKAELEKSNQEIITNHLFSNSEIKEVFYKKLQVTPDQAAFMETLATEGYQGTVENLVKIVKKL